MEFVVVYIWNRDPAVILKILRKMLSLMVLRYIVKFRDNAFQSGNWPVYMGDAFM